MNKKFIGKIELQYIQGENGNDIPTFLMDTLHIDEPRHIKFWNTYKNTVHHTFIQCRNSRIFQLRKEYMKEAKTIISSTNSKYFIIF